MPHRNEQMKCLKDRYLEVFKSSATDHLNRANDLMKQINSLEMGQFSTEELTRIFGGFCKHAKHETEYTFAGFVCYACGEGQKCSCKDRIDTERCTWEWSGTEEELKALI